MGGLRDFTATFRGITTPLPELASQIENLGWELGKVSFSKGQYKATAKSPHGEKIECMGVTDKTAVANVLLSIIRKHKVRTTAQHFGGMWETSWVDRLQELAEAYAKAPTYDPKAAGAWKELAQDSTARANVLREQLTIKVVPDPEPYASAKEMADDIHKNQKLSVSSANCDHPVWSTEECISFRIAYDILGFTVSGSDFSWHGQNLAFAAFAPLLSSTAQKACFVECVMATAYATHQRSYGPHKIFLPKDDIFSDTQKSENPDGHSGVHPSQSIAPTTMPTIKSGTLKLAMRLRDPNHGWQSGHGPTTGQNAYTDMQVKTPDGKSTDPLDAQAVLENASKIDSKWSAWMKEDGTPDREKMRHAIVNAFRVVLLSPRKDLRGNAMHYQDISHIPGNELDPAKYWDALEKSRQEWNVKHHGEAFRYAHLPFKKLLPKMNGVIFAHHPHLTMDQVHQKSNEMIYEWRVEEEHQVLQKDAEKSQDKQKKANDVENEVNKNITKRIKNFVADSVPEMDFGEDPERTSAEQMGFDIDVPTEEVEKPQKEIKYIAFMGTHLNAIAQVSEQSDSILDAALEDVKEHDATGHHFRAVVLQLNISGVGPKVCSFAWLLLQPMTSQLGTIDTHMMDVLGHNYEKEMSTRDYFCFTPENLVRAERGWTPISEISTDDRVLTNSGVFEKVEKIMVREYQGPLVEAKTAVGVTPIRMTPEHPVLKLSNPHKRSDHKNVCSPHKCRATEHLHELTWDNADSLGGNSYIVSRTIDESQLEDVKSIEIGGRTIPLTDDFLWIIGLYLAEGSTGDRVVQFSLNKTETVYQSRVIAFFQKKLNLRVHYAPSREGWNGVQLLIYDARLAKAFSTTFGRGAKNKSIPAGILNLPTNRLGHVFDGIHSGDGCDSTRTLGQTSPTLALQVTEYLLRNGEMPSNSTWDDGDPNHSLAYITKYARPKVHKNKRGFWNLDGEKLVQTTITPSEYRGYVYNLEVAGDHTYVVQNVVVHNCFERELQAGRDASGYGHVPLGAFQWGMWDYKRTGPGTHQDHSAMAVHNPTDHNMIDWKAKTDATQTAKADWAKNAPWWWKQTEEARNQTGEQFHTEVTSPQTNVPFKVESMKKKAESKTPHLPTPWLATNQDIRTGKPGQPYAQFIKETLGIPAHEYWEIPNHAIGRFHPDGGFVEVVNGKIDQDVYEHLKAVLSPYMPAQTAA